MNEVSTIPRVLNWLVERMTLTLPNVMVTDGQPIPPKDSEPDLLCIGYTGDDGETSVENIRLIQQAANSPDRETYEITCLASVWRGNDSENVVVVRDGCFAILNAVGAELAKDKSLGGLVLRARIMTDSFAQEQTDMGAVATVRFVVQVDAFTRG